MESALKEKYKGHARHELPNAAAYAKVTNRLLVAHSPEYSVPLTAAVTYVNIIFSILFHILDVKFLVDLMSWQRDQFAHDYSNYLKIVKRSFIAITIKHIIINITD